METPRFDEENQDFDIIISNNGGDYLTLPVEALSSEGSIEGLTPGDWRFVYSSSISIDSYGRQVMVDTVDRIPEDQTGEKYPAAVKYIEDSTADGQISGYIVDITRAYVEPIDRNMSQSEESIKDWRKFKPVPVIAMAYMNKASGRVERMAKNEHALSALHHLMAQVTTHIERNSAEPEVPEPQVVSIQTKVVEKTRSLLRFVDKSVVPLPVLESFIKE